MKVFLDTAGIEEIRTAARWGVLDGVTTNPSLFARVGGSYDEVLQRICEITPGPVSAEVVADDVEGMLREGRHFSTLAPNIVVKVPMSEEGLEAIARLAQEGIKSNCTLIFSANQGLLAAKAGASLLSPFVGRLDDVNHDGMEVVRELVAIVETHHLQSQVLAASVRSPRHVTEAAIAGAHIATVPLKVLAQMIHHPLTDTGIAQFRTDWERARTPGTDPMTGRTAIETATAGLDPSEAGLILTSLRFLREAEDDPALIRRLNRLIDRLEDGGTHQARDVPA
jgi:transaldolase